jgi:hypothetical protein
VRRSEEADITQAVAIVCGRGGLGGRMRRALDAWRMPKSFLVLAYVAGGAGMVKEEAALHGVGRPYRACVPWAADALQDLRVVGCLTRRNKVTRLAA